MFKVNTTTFLFTTPPCHLRDQQPLAWCYPKYPVRTCCLPPIVSLSDLYLRCQQVEMSVFLCGRGAQHVDETWVIVSLYVIHQLSILIYLYTQIQNKNSYKQKKVFEWYTQQTRPQICSFISGGSVSLNVVGKVGPYLCGNQSISVFKISAMTHNDMLMCFASICGLFNCGLEGTSSMVRDDYAGPFINNRNEEERRAQDRHHEEGPKKHSIQDLGYTFPVLNHLEYERSTCQFVSNQWKY